MRSESQEKSMQEKLSDYLKASTAAHNDRSNHDFNGLICSITPGDLWCLTEHLCKVYIVLGYNPKPYISGVVSWNEGKPCFEKKTYDAILYWSPSIPGMTNISNQQTEP